MIYAFKKSKALWPRITVYVGAVVAAGAIIVLLVLLMKGQRYSDYLLRSLEGPIRYDDSELVEYIRSQVVVRPSHLEYNLEGHSNAGLRSILGSEMFYVNATRLLFKNMQGGVFVEAGALDGETMSNTLKLELRQGWTGLLVEADVASYNRMVDKNRKAWLANVCLAPNSYPSKELLSNNMDLYNSAGSINVEGFKLRAMARLHFYNRAVNLADVWFKLVQCVPLGSLLLAVGIKHIDLMVLDVEGAEMDIVRNLDFDTFDIDVIYLEWKKSKEKDKILEEFENKGYRLFNRWVEDFIFVKKHSKYDFEY